MNNSESGSCAQNYFELKELIKRARTTMKSDPYIFQRAGAEVALYNLKLILYIRSNIKKTVKDLDKKFRTARGL